MEPHSLAGESGAIHLWVEELDEDNFPSGVPRAYRLPYDANLAERAEAAIKASADGKPQGGRTADFGAGEGGAGQATAREVTPSSITTTGGGDPSTGGPLDPILDATRTQASSLRRSLLPACRGKTHSRKSAWLQTDEPTRPLSAFAPGLVKNPFQAQPDRRPPCYRTFSTALSRSSNAPSRPYWKGYLKLSLVSCPIALYTATSSAERVAFRQINKKTGNRLRQQLVDEGTGELVEAADKGRGYEVDKGVYLRIEDEELDAIAVESAHTIEIDHFVPKSQIDERYVDSPYYLVPENKVALEAFAVIRDAMRGKDMVGLGRVVLAKRERVIMLQPRGKGLLGATLRYPYEILRRDALFRRHRRDPNPEGHAVSGRAYSRQQGGAVRPV